MVFFSYTKSSAFPNYFHCNWDDRDFWHTASCKVILTKFQNVIVSSHENSDLAEEEVLYLWESDYNSYRKVEA